MSFYLRECFPSGPRPCPHPTLLLRVPVLLPLSHSVFLLPEPSLQPCKHPPSPLHHLPASRGGCAFAPRSSASSVPRALAALCGFVKMFFLFCSKVHYWRVSPNFSVSPEPSRRSVVSGRRRESRSAVSPGLIRNWSVLVPFLVVLHGV